MIDYNEYEPESPVPEMLPPNLQHLNFEDEDDPNEILEIDSIATSQQSHSVVNSLQSRSVANSQQSQSFDPFNNSVEHKDDAVDNGWFESNPLEEASNDAEPEQLDNSNDGKQTRGWFKGLSGLRNRKNDRRTKRGFAVKLGGIRMGKKSQEYQSQLGLADQGDDAYRE